MSEDIQVEEIWYPLPFFLVSTRRQKIMKYVSVSCGLDFLLKFFLDSISISCAVAIDRNFRERSSDHRREISREREREEKRRVMQRELGGMVRREWTPQRDRKAQEGLGR